MKVRLQKCLSTPVSPIQELVKFYQIPDNGILPVSGSGKNKSISKSNLSWKNKEAADLRQVYSVGFSYIILMVPAMGYKFEEITKINLLLLKHLNYSKS